PDQRGFVIASHPLTADEDWIDLPRGALLAFREGEIAYGRLAN
ncbi:MAG: class II glutamine amidotransferase, partial [Anaerolineales bacterium]